MVIPMMFLEGNDTEMRRGYSTIGGDLEGGFAPLGNVNKLMVYALAIHRNRLAAQGGRTGIIPNGSIYKPPSAELKPGQTDVASLGFPYHLMVLFDQYYSRSNGDIDEVIRRREDIDVKRELSDENFARLIFESIRLYEGSEYKRRQAAPSIVASKGAHTFVVRRPIATKMYVTYDEVLDRVRGIPRTGGGYWFHRKTAAVVETLLARILPVVLLLGLHIWTHNNILSISFWQVVSTMLVIGSIYKFGHLFRGKDATFNNRDVDHLTRLTFLATAPLLLLPVFPMVALVLYGILLIPLTLHHHQVDNRQEFDVTSAVEENIQRQIISLAGPLQKDLLAAEFDFQGTKAILNRRFVGQLHTLSQDKSPDSIETVGPEISNLAYLAGRATIPLQSARIKTKSALNIQTWSLTRSLLFSAQYFRGRIVQTVLNRIFQSHVAFYATGSANEIKPNVVNGFHVDPLVDPAMKGTALEMETKEHLLKRIETSQLGKESRPDILVIRYQPSRDATANESARKKSIAEAENMLLHLAEGSLEVKMRAYLLRKAIIVAEPMGLIKPSRVLIEASARLNIQNIKDVRLDLYTAMADQFDTTESTVRFIIYSILPGMKVLPISKQLEGAKVISINA